MIRELSLPVNLFVGTIGTFISVVADPKFAALLAGYGTALWMFTQAALATHNHFFRNRKK